MATYLFCDILNSCLQRLVRDDRFHARTTEPGTQVDEERWLTVQVLGAVHSIDTLSDENQQEILKASQNIIKGFLS